LLQSVLRLWIVGEIRDSANSHRQMDLEPGLGCCVRIRTWASQAD
jgi:hypothetical protein